MRRTPVIAILLVTFGCQTPAPTEPNVLAQLRDDLARLESQFERSDMQTQALTQDSSERLTGMVTDLATSIDSLHAHVASSCAVSVNSNECDAQTQRVVVTDDKMLLGETEYVWMDPPGFQLDARIDTGADSSSLHATDITEFERDGDNWTRFDMSFNDLSVTIERPVLKYVRVFQQSDREGTRRPVVEMRVFLGDIQDTYEFTLADRSHLQHAVILGRNFLKDVALVDVSRQFVQPVFDPSQR